MKDIVMKCRYCGKKICVITWGVYRKAVVDAEAVQVRADPDGEIFIRVDGSKLRGTEIRNLEDRGGEYAYRPHRETCRG